jgi:hypothetical protein
MLFEARAASGHRIFVRASSAAEAEEIARLRWCKFDVYPGAIAVKPVTESALPMPLPKKIA